MKIAHYAQKPDFLKRRREAALTELVKRKPHASEQRDAVLLRVLGRECRTGDEMEPYRRLLFSQSSTCLEPMTVDNSNVSSQHPHDGKTFDELQSFLNTCKPLYGRLGELSSPLPTTHYYRRTSKKHAEAEAADGRLDHKELFARGFPRYIGAFYVSDGPESIKVFGDTEQQITVQPGTHYLDLGDRKIRKSLRTIFREAEIPANYPIYDLLYKSGIEMVRYRPQRGEHWYNIYNPEVASVVLS